MAPTFRSRLVSLEPLYGAWSVIPSDAAAITRDTAAQLSLARA